MSAQGLIRRLASIDRKLAIITAERAAAVEQIVEDLRWMDVEVRHIRHPWVTDLDSPEAHTVHVVSRLDEGTNVSQIEAHPAATCCSRWCAQEPGETRRTRHRRGLGLQFTFLGTHDVIARDAAGVVCIPEHAFDRRPTRMLEVAS